ncbi:hypothetical protein QOZ80_7BG0584630 [Eleusine coracana subsp. coracana]|nr:hypothetical protein QOZ80_7BG0584630 [Eleusine coracana subsp. coracana]
MAPPCRRPPEMPEELVEEILLRIPPIEPAALVRASLVCKSWGHLISSPRFRHRYRSFHRGPSVMGLICNLKDVNGEYVARYVPASCPSARRHADDLRGWRVLDARHGRVLIRSLVHGAYLDVWDPVTGERRVLTATPPIKDGWNAAVICAGHGTCDHRDCRGGPFLVFVFGANDPDWISLSVYSSETARWDRPRRVAELPEHGMDVVPPCLVGNALYFGIDLSRSILRYDLATRIASVTDQPPGSFGCFTVPMGMKDGGLGLARLKGSTLSLWSLYAYPDGDLSWVEITAIELNRHLPAGALPVSSNFLGCAQGFVVFFVGTEDGLYSFDLKSGIVKKVCDDKGILSVVPYITLYTPALRAY